MEGLADARQLGVLVTVDAMDLVHELPETGHLLPQVGMVGVDDVVGQCGVLAGVGGCCCRGVGQVQLGCDLFGVETGVGRRAGETALTIAAVIQRVTFEDARATGVLGDQIGESGGGADGHGVS